MTELTRREIAALTLGVAATAATASWARTVADWRLGFKTPPETLDSELTLIEGRLPPDLQGSFYRVGPAQFERAGERLGHWFDGDGMVQRFAIGGGRVRHRGRFVATDKRRNEQAAGRFLYPGYGFAPKAAGELRRVDDINAANTSVLPIAGEVWALWEGGSPWRVDAETLDTRGRQAFAGPLDGAPFSAHPKRGPDGDVWNFGVLGRRCVIWRLGPDGAVRKSALVELPEASLMHDFAVTAKHVILLLPPMLGDASGDPKSLVDRYRWHGDRPLRILVLDKNDLTIRRRYELPARFLFHLGNAWEDEAGVIRLDACLDDDATFAVKTARDLALGANDPPLTARPTLLTLSSDGRGEMATLQGNGEFPRTDPRRVGERHRFTYGVVANGLARWDWQAGRSETFAYGADTRSEEPVFIPRPGGTDEADGWLIATALNQRTERTELVVFDARRVAEGPIARLACPYALPLGFHGAFVAA
jgi:all-trans-8'-apo-beta-carotenal 15,15'-oxygenase